MAKKTTKTKTKAVKKVNVKVKTVAKKSVPVKKSSKKITKKIAPKKVSKTLPKASSKVLNKSKLVSKPKNSSKAKSVNTKASAITTSKIVKIDFAAMLTPLDDRILVQIKEEERMTPGGLYIPDTVSDVSGNFKGTVVAVGRGHMNKKGKIKPLDVKPGDVVVFSQFSGSKVDVQGQTVMFLRESDVLGVVNK